MTSIARNAVDRGSAEADVFGGPMPRDAGFETQAATANDVAPSAGFQREDRISLGEEERRRLGWGAQYRPAIGGREERQQFSQICGRVLEELDELQATDCLVDGKVSDEGAGFIAEIEDLLENLFDCRFGDGESLKSVVVAIQSQVNNADWNGQVVTFLREVMAFLRARYVLNDQTVDEVYEIIKECGLDPFRGSVSDRGIKTRYRLVKVDDP